MKKLLLLTLALCVALPNFGCNAANGDTPNDPNNSFAKMRDDRKAAREAKQAAANPGN